MAGTVLYERDGHIATITYNRPEALNAMARGNSAGGTSSGISACCAGI